MIKQVLITSIAAAGLLFTAQASAHGVQSSHHVNGDTVTLWNHSHHNKPVRRPAPKPKKYNVNREQRQQAAMIAQGRKNCRITPREATKLNNRQAKINKAERRMRNSGHGLSYNESMKLKKRLHNARKQINRLTKNGKRCRLHAPKRAHKPRHNHSHGSNHHTHSNGNHFHSHSNWSFSNDKGSFSIGIAH